MARLWQFFYPFVPLKLYFFFSAESKLSKTFLMKTDINYHFLIQLNEFNSAKTWHVIVWWFLCFSPNLPKLNLKLFCSDVKNKFRFSSGKFEAKHRNQLTIICQVLAELFKIWSCLIFIQLYPASSVRLTHLRLSS